MGQAEDSRSPQVSITIDQLLALNTEMAALVRAGVPLERGLLLVGRDLRGRLGQIATALARRLDRGESLPEALAGEEQSIPPLYRAVVEAGARSGQLPVALEGIAKYVQGYSEARTAIGLALWYPLLVVLLAYGLFIGLLWLAIPQFVTTYEMLGLRIIWPLQILSWLSNTVHIWWPVGPVLLFILFVAWVRSGKAARFQAGSWSWLLIFPWMRSILENFKTANFAELLALLLRHKVPYSTAIELAAKSTGDARMTRAAMQLAQAADHGEPLAAAIKGVDRRAMLPMLRWVLSSGQEQGSIVTALESLAKVYRERAHFQTEKLSVLLPTVLMIAIGASATIFYALTLFMPLASMLRDLAVN